MRDESRCLVTGIVPGCIVRFIKNDRFFTTKVFAIHRKGDRSTAVCFCGGRVFYIPIEECQLYRAMAGKLSFNINGEVVNG